ncbi:response regulator [Pseudonocardia acaciae]|uniref:response regulator n=1 Tax=Pseudonocardia acaciae TaxID=551276 RepID=UPI00048FF7D2|nr:response regulator transcription factor [Pseudonocardia acaciae]
MIRVLLADDQTLVRAGFRAILDGEPDIDVVAEAGDGEQTLRAAARHRPDVVLTDIRMPDPDGVHTTARIAGDPHLAAVRVIILTGFDLDEYVYGALRAGASGFLVKDVEPAELVHAVRVVARGDAMLAPSVTARLIARFARRPLLPARLSHRARLRALRTLTAREREVLELVATGLSNDEIAAELVLSPATAKTHVSHVMTKLDARDRAQLVITAYESGLVTPGT